MGTQDVHDGACTAVCSLIDTYACTGGETNVITKFQVDGTLLYPQKTFRLSRNALIDP